MPFGTPLQSIKPAPVASGNPSVGPTSFGSNVTAGNRILLFTTFLASTLTTHVNTPTSSPTLTWTRLVRSSATQSADALDTDLWTAVVGATGALSITVSATDSGTGCELGFVAGEFDQLDGSAGSGCLDVSATGSVGGAPPATTSTATGTTSATHAASQLAIAAFGDWGGGITVTDPTGFSNIAGMTRNADATVTQVISTKTSANGATEGGNFTYTSTADLTAALVAVIKAAGAAIASPPIASVIPGQTWQRRYWKGLRHPIPGMPVVTTQNLSQILSGTVSLTGSGPTRAVGTGLTAGAMSLTGSQPRQTSKGLVAAAFSLTGSQGRQVGKLMSGAVSLTGSQLRAMTKGLTAAVTLTGSTLKAITKAGFTAAVALVGSLTHNNVILRSLSAAMTLTGSYVKLPIKALSGAVSLTGSQSRRIGTGLSAGVALSGSSQRAVAKLLTAAAIAFAGSLASGKQFLRALSAAVSLTGSQSRQMAKGLSAVISLTGSQLRAIQTRLTAAMALAGAEVRMDIKKLTAAILTLAGSFSTIFTSGVVLVQKTKTILQAIQRAANW